MEVKLITAPTTTPISLQEAKDHLYLTADTYNDEVLRKVQEATDYCQRRIRGSRQFCAATYEAVLNAFPITDDARITFPLPPLSAVKFIKYYNSTGTLTTYGSTLGSTASSTSWTMVAPAESPGYVVPAYSLSWPTCREVSDAVTVRFVAGTTDTAMISGSIKAAVKLMLGHLWQNREGVVVGTISAALNHSIDSLLAGNEYGYYA